MSPKGFVERLGHRRGQASQRVTDRRRGVALDRIAVVREQDPLQLRGDRRAG